MIENGDSSSQRGNLIQLNDFVKEIVSIDENQFRNNSR